MKAKLLSLLKMALFLIFPNRCGVCNRVIKINNSFCPACEIRLRPLPHYVSLLWSHGNTNFRNNFQTPKFSGCLAPYLHQSGSRKLIYCYKFKNRLELADLIADKMAESYMKYYSQFDIDMMTAVPMRFAGKIRRGYDQVDVLCNRLEKRINLQYLKLLKQTGKKKPQHTISQARLRQSNVKGIYSFIGKQDVKGKRILLVDDIITTGSTVNECSKVLLKAGAKEVLCLSATISG